MGIIITVLPFKNGNYHYCFSIKKRNYHYTLKYTVVTDSSNPVNLWLEGASLLRKGPSHSKALKVQCPLLLSPSLWEESKGAKERSSRNLLKRLKALEKRLQREGREEEMLKEGRKSHGKGRKSRGEEGEERKCWRKEEKSHGKKWRKSKNRKRIEEKYEENKIWKEVKE